MNSSNRRRLVGLFILALLLPVGCNKNKTSGKGLFGRKKQDDRSVIESLHQFDMQAMRAGRYDLLPQLWTEDYIVLPPERAVIRGRSANKAAFDDTAEMLAGVEVLEYVLDFEEVLIFDDVAVEWGTYRGIYRVPGKSDEIIQTGKLMRILRKQRDGSWRIARSIYN